jgi:hypothetical protein
VTPQTRALVSQLSAYDAAVTEIAKWLTPEQRPAVRRRLCQMRDDASGASWEALDRVCAIVRPIDPFASEDEPRGVSLSRAAPR